MLWSRSSRQQPGYFTAESTVRKMLTAMDAPLYDIGVLSDRGILPRLDGIPAAAVLDRLSLLKYRNVRGSHIYIRPIGRTSLYRPRRPRELHKRVISQDKAINALARAIRRSRAGLKTSTKPIGSFLFLGPTGVGKTEAARTLGSSCSAARSHWYALTCPSSWKSTRSQS